VAIPNRQTIFIQKEKKLDMGRFITITKNDCDKQILDILFIYTSNRVPYRPLGDTIFLSIDQGSIHLQIIIVDI
jgi:hypothetical protein